MVHAHVIMGFIDSSKIKNLPLSDTVYPFKLTNGIRYYLTISKSWRTLLTMYDTYEESQMDLLNFVIITFYYINQPFDLMSGHHYPT